MGVKRPPQQFLHNVPMFKYLRSVHSNLAIPTHIGMSVARKISAFCYQTWRTVLYQTTVMRVTKTSVSPPHLISTSLQRAGKDCVTIPDIHVAKAAFPQAIRQIGRAHV